MALTASEEALVRQLLDQQAAILSLAGNEATITSKLGATKVTLADLVAVSSMSDSDLLLTRQGTTDKSVRADILAAYMASELEVTPPQFDNDTSLATTAFVQRALGNMSSAKIVNSTGDILAADAGKFIEVLGSSGNITLTLPDISTVPSGTTFEFYNNSGFACIIQRSGSATIADGSGVAQTSYALRVQSTARLISDGFNWFLTTGVGGYQLATTGYQRLPSGLIIQWGNLTTDGGGNGTFTHPIAFPNTRFSPIVSVAGAAGEYDVTWNDISDPTPLVSTKVRSTLSGAPQTASVQILVLGY